MNKTSARTDLSLKWLEVFQICAQRGSLQSVAKETGLSVSTVSHHLRSLEKALGAQLLDHKRRPMVLTPKGQVFLRTIEDALTTIRKAQAEASSGDVAEVRYLRIATIEDFDSEIAPELAVSLFKNMPNCDFRYITDDSHMMFDMLRDRKLDLAISTEPAERIPELIDRPILRDPYVLVMPAHGNHTVRDVIDGTAELPLLRFSSDQIVARQIEAQLRRSDVVFPHRFECSNHQTLMAMVAAGTGWTITTPMLFSRSKQFHHALAVHPFPGKSFSRTISLVSNADCSQAVLELVESEIRRLITRISIEPVVDQLPWLSNSFRLVDL